MGDGLSSQHRYLEALGLELFVPCRKLAGVPAHYVYARSNDATTSLQRSSQAPQSVARPASGATTRPPESRSSRTTTARDIRFCVQVCVTDDVVLVDCLSESVLDKRWQSLAMSLLSVCGLSKPDSVPRTLRTLLWPPEGVHMLSELSERAHGFLKTELTALLAGADKVFVCGLNEQSVLTPWIRECVSPESALTVLNHSLTMALRKASVKKALWRELQPAISIPEDWF